MSVFAKLKLRSEQYAGKRKPDQLEQGVPYTCYLFNQRKSDYPDKKTNECPMTLVAYIKDIVGTNKYYVTIPAFYNGLSENDVKELNAQVELKKPPFLVYYGKDGMRNDLVLHEFSESIDEAKLQAYQTPS